MIGRLRGLGGAATLASIIAFCAPTPGDAAIVARSGPDGLVTYPDAAATCGSRPDQQFVQCVSQTSVLAAAARRARTDHKALLVSVGADWCIWCHVIARYFDGWTDDRIEPPAAGTRADALDLAAFMRDSFVVVELNTEAPDISDALAAIRVDPRTINGLPSFYILKSSGPRFVDMERAELPKRGDFRGYNRKAVLGLLRAALE